MISHSEKQRISNLNQELYSIARGISVLKYLRWDIGVKHAFFKNNEARLPEVLYEKADFSNKLKQLENLKNKVESSPFDIWMLGQINTITTTLLMLQSVGTADFYTYSCSLYGAANDTLLDGKTTSLSLAKKFKLLLDQDYKANQEIQLFDSASTKQKMESQIRSMFGEKSPRVELSENIASKASASVKRIRLKREGIKSKPLIIHNVYSAVD